MRQLLHEAGRSPWGRIVRRGTVTLGSDELAERGAKVRQETRMEQQKAEELLRPLLGKSTQCSKEVTIA